MMQVSVSSTVHRAACITVLLYHFPFPAWPCTTGSAPSYAIFHNSDMYYLCFGPLNQAPINYYSVILRSNITIIIIYALFSLRANQGTSAGRLRCSAPMRTHALCTAYMPVCCLCSHVYRHILPASLVCKPESAPTPCVRIPCLCIVDTTQS